MHPSLFLLPFHFVIEKFLERETFNKRGALPEITFNTLIWPNHVEKALHSASYIRPGPIPRQAHPRIIECSQESPPFSRHILYRIWFVLTRNPSFYVSKYIQMYDLKLTYLLFVIIVWGFITMNDILFSRECDCIKSWGCNAYCYWSWARRVGSCASS